ncbi:hypothetical protein JHK87_043222 [Glycine soja]|nr:hypothetical protein JHK87_043222 [Glycine soja]
MCKCGSCGTRKKTLRGWEKHTGCRIKPHQTLARVSMPRLQLASNFRLPSDNKVPTIMIGRTRLPPFKDFLQKKQGQLQLTPPLQMRANQLWSMPTLQSPSKIYRTEFTHVL